MYTTGLALDDLQYERSVYDGSRAYARTKRALVALTEVWAERLKDSGVVVHAMHPGWADTPGVAGSLPGFHRITRRFLRTAEQGADTITWLAAAPGGGQGQRHVLARPRAAYHPRPPRHRSIASATAGTAGRAGEADRSEQDADRGPLALRQTAGHGRSKDNAHAIAVPACAAHCTRRVPNDVRHGATARGLDWRSQRDGTIVQGYQCGMNNQLEVSEGTT